MKAFVPKSCSTNLGKAPSSFDKNIKNSMEQRESACKKAGV
jgi:hypothetical protein